MTNSLKKMRSYRFSDETTQKLTKLALTEAIMAGKQVSNTELIEKLITKAYKKLIK